MPFINHTNDFQVALPDVSCFPSGAASHFGDMSFGPVHSMSVMVRAC